MNAPLAYAFGLGMVATVNPCGFAMLPAYLSFFLGLEGGRPDERRDRTVIRAVQVSAMLTLGFIAVFAVVGIAITNVSRSINDVVPYLTIVIGLGLVVLGVAMLRGFEPTLSLPKLERGGNSGELSSMFLFGVSYAIASIGCTIGLFLNLVSTTFTDTSFAAGVASFVFYGLGMGSVVLFLTLAVALARTSLVARLRQSVRYVNRVSAVLLILAGSYIAYYAWYEIRIRDTIRRDPIVDFFTDQQSRISNWIDQVGPTTLGIVLGVASGAIIIAVLARRRTGPRPDRAPSSDR
jgi:cytochrome c-type biogenesis protein